MKKTKKILLVDDEKTFLITLEKMILKAYPESTITYASDGLEAWNYIKQNHPDIVISDYRMPKMDGIQLCNRIRSNDGTKSIYFIIITTDANTDKRIEALQVGADDYMTKPPDNDEVLSRLINAFRITDYQNELAENNKLLLELADELEQNIEDTSMLALKFIQARIPNSFDMLLRISKAACWIANELNEIDDDGIRDIQIASYFSLAGKMFLPDELLSKPVQIDGQASNKLMYQVPVTAKEIVSSVRRFRDCSQIVYHIFENFDGSGFPERLQSWQIPIGSRIIRVALDYEIMKETSGRKPREILTILNNDIKRLYDHRMVILMDQYIRSVLREDYDPNERALKLHELKDGMRLSKDIITTNGLKLVSAGVVLREDIIEKILTHNTSDPILGNIFVTK